MKYRFLTKEGELNLDPGIPGMDYLIYESRPHILPISEMRDTARISSLAEDSAVCITKNGYSHLWVYTDEAHGKLMDRLDFLEAFYSCEMAERGDNGMGAGQFRASARSRYDV